MERKRKANIIVPFTTFQRTNDNRYMILTLQHFQNHLFYVFDFGIFPLIAPWNRLDRLRLFSDMNLNAGRGRRCPFFFVCFVS